MIAAPNAPLEPPERWAWHYHALQALIDRLLDQRSDRLSEAGEPMDPPSLDLVGSATDELDHTLALSLLSREQDALHEVMSAIHRILDGTYGVCEDSGEPIPADRLRTMPWARRTREAQERADRLSINPPARLGLIGCLRGTPPFDPAPSASDTDTHALIDENTPP